VVIVLNKISLFLKTRLCGSLLQAILSSVLDESKCPSLSLLPHRKILQYTLQEVEDLESISDTEGSKYPGKE
jgi:hypothetical protein